MLRIVGEIKLKDPVVFTGNLFGKVADLDGQRVAVLEENKWGECLAIAQGKDGQAHLVNVDPRDIAERYERKIWPDAFAILGIVEEYLQKAEAGKAEGE